MEDFQIRPNLCTKVRFSGSSCQKCLSACPVNAIQFDDQSIKVTRDCTGCEFCVALCPNEVFSTNRTTWASAEKACHSDPIYCSMLLPNDMGTGNDFPPAIIPCLGSIPPHFILSRVLEKEAPIEIVTGACGPCRMKDGAIYFQRRENEIRALFDRLGVGFHPVTIRTGDESDALRAKTHYETYLEYLEKKSTLSRREFFLNFRGHVSPAQTKEKGLENSEGDFESDTRKPTEYVRQLINLFKKNRGAASLNGPLQVFVEIEIDENCTGCGACAGLCPSGALRLEEDHNISELLWTPAHCSRCNLCRDVCSKEALHFTPCLALEKIINETRTAIKRFYRQCCPECERTYLSIDPDTPCIHCSKTADLMEDLSMMIYGEGLREEPNYGK